MKLGSTANRAAVAGAAALAVVGMSAATASAGTTASVRGAGGGGYFYNYSEVLSASDYKADGYSVKITLTTVNGKSASVRASGVNKHREKQLHIKEGTRVFLQMCYQNSKGHGPCSKLHRGTA